MKYYSTKARLSARHGFTLIEILIVIAIIGILASVVVGNLLAARIKARDAQRTRTFEELQNSLELYYSDNGAYPCGDTNVSGGPNNGWTSDTSLDCPLDESSDDPGFLNGGTASNCIGLQTGLKSAGYIPTNCPKDVVNVDDGTLKQEFFYMTDPARQGYVLSTYLEASVDKMANDGGMCDDAYEVGHLRDTGDTSEVGPAGCL